MDVKSFVNMIARRDDISVEEAQELFEDARDAINDVIESDSDDYSTLNEIEEILRSDLGVEPDYLDLFLLGAM